MNDNYPTDIAVPFGTTHSKAKDVAQDLGYVSTFTLMRRWRQLGYMWVRFGGDVWLPNAEKDRFISNSTHKPDTAYNSEHPPA